MLANQFAGVFRQEHREIRDTLVGLAEAFKDRDKERISQAIHNVAELMGPHFRYEEEALYPSLVEIFGEDYIEELLSGHDRAIGTARALSALAAKMDLDSQDSQNAAAFVRSMLPHVSDCEGLSIMVEMLPDERVRKILDAREACRREGLDLQAWASMVRKRPYMPLELEGRPTANEPDPTLCIPGA